MVKSWGKKLFDVICYKAGIIFNVATKCLIYIDVVLRLPI